MQLWDEVLYPTFRAIIRGTYYGIIDENAIDEECYYLAERAIAAFKFPRISTEYRTFYAIRLQGGSLDEVDCDADGAIPHAMFINNLSRAELEIIIAWMKVYWCENQISSADNFEDMYTDVNIKTYSRANAVAQNTKLMAEYRKYARDLETRYSRTKNYKPTLGDINE